MRTTHFGETRQSASSPNLTARTFSSDSEVSLDSSQVEEKLSPLKSIRRRLGRHLSRNKIRNSPKTDSSLFFVAEDSTYHLPSESDLSSNVLSSPSDSEREGRFDSKPSGESVFRRHDVAQLIRSRSLSTLNALQAARQANRKAVDDFSKVMKNVKTFTKKEFQVAKAEATQFISSPHLLFEPLRLSLALLFPFIVPFAFVPWLKLLLYYMFLFVWYIVLVLIFASEVAMRPPWYRPGDMKNGLSMIGLPDYWQGVCHDPKYDLGLDYEKVEFYNSQNKILRGWFVCAKKPKKCMVVCVHGAGRDRRAFLRHTAMLHAANFDVLLFDLSEHGLSDGSGKGFAFGVREKYDVIAAARFLREQKGAECIVLMGTSAGASSAILAAALMPSIVDAVVAENPFTRATDLFCYHLELLFGNYLPKDSYHVARRLLFLLASRVLLFRIGQGIRDYGAVDAAKDLVCPILVLHGTSDEIVPFEHGKRIFEAAPEPKAFFEARDAVHCALFDKEPEKYRSAVIGFLRQNLPNCF
ncbi:uncharacterized protein Gasu_15100 [Galdieria sulphuraria]|uniref:AB hydrolase-1 domain-containing protein n=1 Tax=Galdieria sulphuraria TaxID=130081 RepID=M2W685_GALSU|nr:uncharacterized protein Gasu_15100 [Galdieria sulphuraria]EME31271.1 hypothetical protein Gasu_15100 [Galdieria sulphuraria]|eukprot:XP_005707791.1 hypothetical protein Gasu_15100 [Galdieria sulphuraria]